jgi:hypothetical protein
MVLSLADGRKALGVRTGPRQAQQGVSLLIAQTTG